MGRQRLKVLDIIRRKVSETGQWPTAREVADEMQWNGTSAVTDSLTALVRYGHLRKVNNYGPVMQRYKLVE